MLDGQATQDQDQDQDQDQEQNQESETRKTNAGGSAFYKQKLNEMKTEVEKYKAELEAERTKKLQEREDYKQLWENEKQKRENAESKHAELSKTVYDNFKRSAIREEAIKAGILPTAVEDLDLLDPQSVEIETTDQGNINVLGAKEFVELYKERKPHWFKNLNPPTINNARAVDTTASNNLSAADIIKLQVQDPEKYKQIMNKRLGRS